MSKRTKSLILGLILTVGGAIAVIAFGPGRVMEAYGSESWPSTSGQVVRTELRTSRGRRSGTTYYVDVFHAYQVGGKDYQGDRYSVNGDASFSTKSRAVDFASSLPAGSEVSVHYDPDDPARSVLRPGGAGKAWLNLGFGFLVLGIGVFLLIRNLRTPR